MKIEIGKKYRTAGGWCATVISPCSICPQAKFLASHGEGKANEWWHREDGRAGLGTHEGPNDLLSPWPSSLPEDFEFTGEKRMPKNGEYFFDQYTGGPACEGEVDCELYVTWAASGPVEILRKRGEVAAKEAYSAINMGPRDIQPCEFVFKAENGAQTLLNPQVAKLDGALAIKMALAHNPEELRQVADYWQEQLAIAARLKRAKFIDELEEK